jgi:hypothetical protein
MLWGASVGVTSEGMNALREFEKKIVRKIYVHVKEEES